MEDTQTPSSEVINEEFPDDADGQLFYAPSSWLDAAGRAIPRGQVKVVAAAGLAPGEIEESVPP